LHKLKFALKLAFVTARSNLCSLLENWHCIRPVGACITLIHWSSHQLSFYKYTPTATVRAAHRHVGHEINRLQHCLEYHRPTLFNIPFQTVF